MDVILFLLKKQPTTWGSIKECRELVGIGASDQVRLRGRCSNVVLQMVHTNSNSSSVNLLPRTALLLQTKLEPSRLTKWASKTKQYHFQDEFSLWVGLINSWNPMPSATWVPEPLIYFLERILIYLGMWWLMLSIPIRV